MSKTLVSVIMPTYNGASLILKTLESVKRQTYTNWEIVVVNDCSIDNTIEIVEQFKQEVPNTVKLVNNKKNLGVSESRNIAVEKAKGVWLALLDSDDLWLSNHLELMVNCLEKDNSLQVIYSGCTVFQNHVENIIDQQRIEKKMLTNFNVSLFTHQIGINSSTAFIKKSSWIKCGGMDKEFNFGEEKEMFIRLAKSGARFKFTGSHTVLYRKHLNAASNQTKKMVLGNLELYLKHYDWDDISLKIRKRKLANAHLSYARILRSHDKRVALKHSLEAFKVKKSIKNLLFCLLIFFS